ncbi:MAG: hypothetical protein V4669_11105 [Pseudomonadota bacterium]
MASDKPMPAKKPRSDFLDSLWKGALLGGLVLVIALPWLRSRTPAPAVPAVPTVAVAPAPGQVAPADPASSPPAVADAPVAVPAPQAQSNESAKVIAADFGSHQPSSDARRMANWIVQASDNNKHSFVIVDKKDARVYVFDGMGRMKNNTPALMGSAHGDDSAPGIGDKPLSQVKPEEKTTPAGRYVAELGVNTNGEDIVWVDYDAAVSMHRVRANNKAERRMERLASPTAQDNRISFGCINLPKPFYEKVLQPTVKAGQTIVYVLPETRPLEKTFASFKDPSTTLAQR